MESIKEQLTKCGVVEDTKMLRIVVRVELATAATVQMHGIDEH